MRILMLTQYFAPETGATSIRLRAIIRELRRRHEVEPMTALVATVTQIVVDDLVQRQVAPADKVVLLPNARTATDRPTMLWAATTSNPICPGRRSWRGSSGSCWPAARRGGMPPACALREPPPAEP
jgi:hypothetical protein